MKLIDNIYIIIENLTLRVKLAALFTGLLGAIALFIFLYFPDQLEKFQMKTVAAKGESIAELTAFSISQALFLDDQENIQNAIKSAMQDKDIKYLIILNAQDSISCSINRHIALKADYKQVTKSDEIPEKELFYKIKKQIIYKDLKIGSLYLGMSISDLKDNVQSNRNTIALISIVIFAFGLIAIVWISTVITKPLRRIAQAAEGISAGNITHRVDYKSNDEVGQLAAAFDTMIDKLWITQEEMEALNNNLEERVEQRTKELKNEIRERELTEEALVASEDLNRGIIANSPIGILYIDAGKKIISGNPAMEHLLGIKEQNSSSIVGKSIQDISNFVNSDIEEILEKVFNGADVQGTEIKFKSEGGEKKLLDIYASQRYGSDNEVVGAVLMFVDITDIKYLEEQLLQAQKMEAVGALAGGIAHDFNNILTVIIGNLEYIILKKDANINVIPLIEQAKVSAERAAKLTEQLLAFGRRRIAEPKPTDLNECIEESIQLMRRTINPMIRIIAEKAPDLQIVKADSGQIQQVLMNLMINACDAMNDNGTLTIKSENIVIDEKYCNINTEAVPGKYVIISVNDTGIGINHESITRIFEPFFTTKEIGKGTGLGLAMVYGIIKEYNGWISVDSVEGTGTSFQIYLPTAEQEEKTVEKKAGRRAVIGGNETILLVDDEEMVRGLGTRILESVGYNTISASDGVEAVEIFSREVSNIDLVILDLLMPRKSGRETMVELKKMNPDTRIILASGYDYQGDIQELLDNGAKEFIQKPFKLEILLKLIRKVLDE